jgi:hypothetical protein
MKFSIIYADPFARPRALDVDAESLDLIRSSDIDSKLNIDVATIYGVVDYEGRRVIPAVLTAEGKIMEVPDGDYGILTPAEWFEEQSG